MDRRKIKINFFSSRLISIISFLIIVYAAFGLAKITWQNYQVNQRIASLEKDINKLNEDNLELKNKIAYYKTNSYKERQAREKLNLQKPGEIVIVIPANLQTEEKKEELNEQPKEKIPNFQKWWNYFFAN